ncbi:MAG TPA: histidine kinase [Bacteroidales bacterium]|nr:histidine kinase [Bacteroidales bacterium]
MKARLFIILQVIFFSGFAQQYSYRHYTIFDGLPQNQVVNVFQRSDGIFLYGTKNEIGGFDGSRFRTYNDRYITKSFVEGFFEIGDQFFYYTREALVRFENKQSSLIKDFNGFGVHTVIVNAGLREIYFLSDTALCVIHPGRENFYYKNHDMGFIADMERIPGSCDFLLSTGKGVYRLDCNKQLTPVFTGQGNQIVVVDNKLFVGVVRNNKLPSEFDGIYCFDENQPRKIYAYGNNIPGAVMLKTKNNQLLINQNSSVWIRLDTSGHILDRDSIPDMIINDIFEDCNGNLFIGTENGLLHQQSYAFRNYDWKSAMPRYVWSIFEDKDSTLVFATFHGRLFQLRNNIMSEVQGYRKNMDINEVFYMGGFCNSLGQWMIPTNYRIFINDHGQYRFLPLLHEGNFSTCLATFEDTIEKNVYFGTTNGLFIYNLLSGKLKHVDTKGYNILAIEKDRNDDYWICTNKLVYLLKNDSILQTADHSGLPNVGVISCKKDTLGNMWYARKDGLYLYNYAGHIKISEGHYFFVSLWKNKKIIAGGVEGISVIDLNMFYAKNPSALQHFDRFNGFLGIECGQNGTCIDSKNHVWIPTSESVVRFDPEKTMYDSVPPTPFIVSFERSSKSLLWKDISIAWKPTNAVYHLDPGESNIRILYDGLDYVSLEKMKFRYRLIGYSEYWTETTDKEAIFTNLSPGFYQFELTVANGNGIWSKDPHILKFNIKPAFYQTWGFRIGVAIFDLLAVAGIVYLIMRRKQKRKNQERQVQKELVAMQVKTINAQLDPHFIFNTITAIGSEVQEKNNDKAYSYFVKISQLLRNSIKDTDKIIRTIEEELKFVENYLSLQKFRFEERFNYSIQVDPLVSFKQKVPKMCVQIFVENAMKHGIEQLMHGGLLRISISKKQDKTVFIVEDNGVGRAASAKNGTQSTGVGLLVFSEFFEIMNRYNDNPAGFVIHDLKNENGEALGTRVELTIPDSYQYEIQ